MKILLLCSLALCLTLPAAVATASVPAKSAPAPTPPAAAPAPTPAPTPSAPSLTLDAYVADLADQLALSKDEQTDIKAYYQEDGARMQTILNDPSLSPLQQQQQIDDLRDARNGKIEALLKDVDRQAKFLQLEGAYRVALVELATQGGLVPTSTPPNVPQPTQTPSAQASKPQPGTVNADAAPR
jgi:glucose/arabinose dehydrogenase